MSTFTLSGHTGPWYAQTRVILIQYKNCKIHFLNHLIAGVKHKRNKMTMKQNYRQTQVQQFVYDIRSFGKLLAFFPQTKIGLFLKAKIKAWLYSVNDKQHNIKVERGNAYTHDRDGP